jgi:hypothetical protein
MRYILNPLQRGFTEHSTPLISSLMLEEVGRENKDNKKPTIIGMLVALYHLHRWGRNI